MSAVCCSSVKNDLKSGGISRQFVLHAFENPTEPHAVQLFRSGEYWQLILCLVLSFTVLYLFLYHQGDLIRRSEASLERLLARIILLPDDACRAKGSDLECSHSRDIETLPVDPVDNDFTVPEYLQNHIHKVNAYTSKMCLAFWD